MLNQDLLKKLQVFSKYSNHTIDEFEQFLKSSRKNIILDIEKINDSLQFYQLLTLTNQKGRIRVPDATFKRLLDKMNVELVDYIFQEERPDLIILFLLLTDEYVSINHLEDLVRVSKNSILSDLKIVRKILSDFSISLHYSRQKGYYLIGEALAIRQLLENTLASLLGLSIGEKLIYYTAHKCKKKLSQPRISAIWEELGRENKIHFISDRIIELSWVCSILEVINLPSVQTENKEVTSHFDGTRLLGVLNSFLFYYPSLVNESYFLKTRLLGAIQGEYYDFPDIKVLNIMQEIIDSVKVHTGLYLQDTVEFRRNFYTHLLPAYYRVLLDISLHNPLKEQIMQDYSSLFYLIKRSMNPLEISIGRDISDDEVAYFTSYFGGHLERKSTTEEKKLVALSICPNGISSSLLMQSELQKIFPQIFFKEVHQLDRIDEMEEGSFDMIFSTVPFESIVPLYVIQPLMNPIEKVLLKKQVCKDFQWSIGEKVSIVELLQIIEKHSIIKNREELVTELADYMIGNHHQIIKTGGIGLLDILTKEMIQQVTEVSDWKEAIRLAAKPLLDKKIIENTYIEAMIDSVIQLGAYIVLAPKVAVPHAAPESGVSALGMSLLQISKPVDFDLLNENDVDKQVQLIFVLAAIDSTSHLKSLQELTLVLEEEEVIQELIKAENPEEILEGISRVIEGVKEA